MKKVYDRRKISVAKVISVTKTAIHNVPTNIITGFLGAGKTTVIMNLLKHKPANERWAVLVNEFGEIGVDGSLLQGQGSDKQVFIREVPGGCMCCAAGVPMQVALNQLLKEAKPDRLLIEPTGLGHPKEILQVLNSEHYQKSLSIQKTITLVDARSLADPRYTEHETFNQQIAIADIVVGNKQDLYQQGDHEKLQQYVEGFDEKPKQVVFTQHGELLPDLLTGGTITVNAPTHVLEHHEHNHEHSHNHSHENKAIASELPMPESGVIKAQNKGEGFVSVGWRFSAEKIFNHQKLQQLFSTLQVERLKAVFITDNGMIAYNASGDDLKEIALTELVLSELNESKIEIITNEIDDDFETQLMATII